MKLLKRYCQRMIFTTFLMGIQYVYGMGAIADKWNGYRQSTRGLISVEKVVEVICKGTMASESSQNGEEETWIETVTRASRIGRL